MRRVVDVPSFHLFVLNTADAMVIKLSWLDGWRWLTNKAIFVNAIYHHLQKDGISNVVYKERVNNDNE